MQKFKIKSPVIRFAVIAFAVLVFFEIFIFNFNSYRLIGSGLEASELSLSDAKLINFEKSEKNGEIKLSADSDKRFSQASIEIANVNSEVKTISFLFDEIKGTEKINASIQFTDSTSSLYAASKRTSVSVDLINGNKKSHTIPLQLSGEVGKLLITFNVPKDDVSFVLSGIRINKVPTFHFSILRLMILYGIILAIYALLKAKSLKTPFVENYDFNKKILIAATIFFIIFAIALSSTSEGLSIFRHTSGNQMTEELVDAFKAGQVHLLKEPSEELLALENPYDGTQRAAAGVSYLWDHCLYNGKYYSYYGIAPVLLLFLPYNLLTGYYFASSLAVQLFAVIGIIFISLLYVQVIKRWFKKLPGAFAIMGFFILHFSSGIWVNLARPLFYETAIAAGFASVAIGAYFLITSNILNEGKISLLRLSLSSVFLSLAVLSRPTLAVYCVAALFFIYFGIEKLKDENGKHNKKALLKYAFASMTPYAFFGMVQVVYNYLRFGNPLDFGIQYSLTINDFTNSAFDIQFVAILIFAYLLNSPAFVPKFPFVTSDFHTLNTNGYMFVDYKGLEGNSIGLIFRALPMFAYLLGPKVYKALGKPKKSAILLGVTCLLAPIIIVSVAWESGYATRYNADFSWIMLIGALVILFKFYEYQKEKGVKQIILYAMVFATFMSLLVNFAQNYYFAYNIYSAETRAIYLYLARLFEFWR